MRRSVVNSFANPDAILDYEAWYQTRGRRADHLEKAFLKRLLARFPQARSLLEIGCGTGHFTRWFGEQGLQSWGVDLSLPMLAEAVRLGSPPCVRGDSLAFPFSSQAFDLVALITTLEFLADPVRALGEALRVARQGVLLGVLNRHSLCVLFDQRTSAELIELVQQHGQVCDLGDFQGLCQAIQKAYGQDLSRHRSHRHAHRPRHEPHGDDQCVAGDAGPEVDAIGRIDRQDHRVHHLEHGDGHKHHAITQPLSKIERCCQQVNNPQRPCQDRRPHQPRAGLELHAEHLTHRTLHPDSL